MHPGILWSPFHLSPTEMGLENIARLRLETRIVYFEQKLCVCGAGEGIKEGGPYGLAPPGVTRGAIQKQACVQS